MVQQPPLLSQLLRHLASSALTPQPEQYFKSVPLHLLARVKMAWEPPKAGPQAKPGEALASPTFRGGVPNQLRPLLK